MTTRNSPPIFYVAGTKGGVGKSLVSMALVDYLVFEKKVHVLMIETDLVNSDAAKTYQHTVDEFMALSLDYADGWIELLNICEKFPEHHVVVNTGARDMEGVERHGKITQDLVQIRRTFVALWVINAQRDSVELLLDYMQAMRDESTGKPIGKLHVIRNSGVNYRSDFPKFDGTDAEKAVASNGGRIVTFPTLAQRVVDDIYNDRIPISQANERMPLGNRAELNRWRTAVYSVLTEVLGDAV